MIVSAQAVLTNNNNNNINNIERRYIHDQFQEVKLAGCDAHTKHKQITS